MRHPFFSADFTAMAHRGFHGQIGSDVVIENTMRAFENAVALGYRHLESDVHVTRDGVAVLIHDPDLGRVGGQAVTIADISWAELSTRRLVDGQGVPRLEEVLSAWPEVRLNLDAKIPGAVGPMATAIHAHRAEERVCVGSFSHRTVLTLRALLPRAAHSASPVEVARWRLARGRTAAHAYMVPTSSGPLRIVTPASVARAHESGAQVHVWTVNDEAGMRELVRLGVHGVMTDRADLLKDVLISEGRWT